ncbi:unnamed protein product [Hermetia illucens]|uniref:Uncharacterized protein n=1 Tax=Hermetia illucens TaxID=343691 RepID=A0A7R8USD2_HERIL|nr:unnamed protein product [Hermetia illucens]
MTASLPDYPGQISCLVESVRIPGRVWRPDTGNHLNEFQRVTDTLEPGLQLLTGSQIQRSHCRGKCSDKGYSD